MILIMKNMNNKKKKCWYGIAHSQMLICRDIEHSGIGKRQRSNHMVGMAPDEQV
jgi:hypothetical protein